MAPGRLVRHHPGRHHRRRHHRRRHRRQHHHLHRHHHRARTVPTARNQRAASAYSQVTRAGAPHTCTTAHCTARLTKAKLVGASATTTISAPSDAARTERGFRRKKCSCFAPRARCLVMPALSDLQELGESQPRRARVALAVKLPYACTLVFDANMDGPCLACEPAEGALCPPQMSTSRSFGCSNLTRDTVEAVGNPRTTQTEKLGHSPATYRRNHRKLFKTSLEPPKTSEPLFISASGLPVSKSM